MSVGSTQLNGELTSLGFLFYSLFNVRIKARDVAEWVECLRSKHEHWVPFPTPHKPVMVVRTSMVVIPALREVQSEVKADLGYVRP